LPVRGYARCLAFLWGPRHYPPVDLARLFRRALVEPHVSDPRSRVHRLSVLINLTTLLAAAALFAACAVDVELHEDLTRKDGPDGAGLVENLTVVVLIPGILARALALSRMRRRGMSIELRGWLTAWTLALIHFAGEECSWGRWWFGWATPDVIARLNDHDETNFHNLSSWLDQQPRFVVELFIIVARLVRPYTTLDKRDAQQSPQTSLHGSRRRPFAERPQSPSCSSASRSGSTRLHFSASGTRRTERSPSRGSSHST